MRYIIDKVIDEDFVKLRFQSFKGEDYKIDNYYVEIFNEKILKTATFKDLIIDGILRKENKNLAYVDSVKLEIGKKYFFKYRYSGKWKKKTVTRFTSNGMPWASDGVITDGLWFVTELDEETELKYFAIKWLSENNITDKTLPEIFVTMYIKYKAEREDNKRMDTI